MWREQHRDLQATLAAIERRTAAAHSALDAKYASALGGLDMRLSAATTQLSATSNSVHQHRRSIVGVSSLETRVASGEATVRVRAFAPTPRVLVPPPLWLYPLK